MLAPAPLYATVAISPLPLIVFHLAMAGLLAGSMARREGLLPPPSFVRTTAFVYLVFYLVDAIVLSRSLIKSSTHLLLFIAVYQTFEAQWHIREGSGVRGQGSERKNEGVVRYGDRNRLQRLLVTAFLFVAGVATATHPSIVLFILLFAFLLFRQLIDLSRQATATDIGRPYPENPSTRAALFYVFVAGLAAMALFPMLPRVRNPIVRGIAPALENAATGLSETIDFANERTISSDPRVVARVWMPQDVVPFFTPLRLRARAYDWYRSGVWSARPYVRRAESTADGFRIARPVGFSRRVNVQQNLGTQNRLFLPAGTHAVEGVGTIIEAPARDTYSLVSERRLQLVNFEVLVSRTVRPLKLPELESVSYPITPQVSALAQSIAGGSTAPLAKGAKIESYLNRNYRYVADPASIGRTITVDEFLLREKRGHCEYFAAAMVVLLDAVGVKARIVGGFYGGKLNPLTGYFVLRKSDAHAWVELFDGEKWVTFDPTPPDLRPGTAAGGLLGAYLTAVGESIGYFWDRYILTFGLADQITLMISALSRLRGLFSGVRGVGVGTARVITSQSFLVALLAIGIAVTLAGIWRRHRRPLFAEMVARLAQLGLVVPESATASELVVLVSDQHPSIAAQLEPIVDLYLRDRFGAERASSSELAAARRRLADLRR